MDSNNTAFRKYSDAAKRIADEMTMHTLAGKAGHWASFKLSDGTSDHNAYPERVTAVRVNKWDRDNYVYLEVTPDGMEAKAAEAFLSYARFLHSQGWRLPDPEDFDYDPTMPAHSWDQVKTAKHLVSGGSYT